MTFHERFWRGFGWPRVAGKDNQDFRIIAADAVVIVGKQAGHQHVLPRGDRDPDPGASAGGIGISRPYRGSHPAITPVRPGQHFSKFRCQTTAFPNVWQLETRG